MMEWWIVEAGRICLFPANFTEFHFFNISNFQSPCLQKAGAFFIFSSSHEAGVAELVDALDSKSSAGNSVRVRFPPSAPHFNPRITT